MAVFGSAGFTWTGEGEPELLLGARVSASYFDVLGVEPIFGRSFLPDDPGHPGAVIVNEAFVRRYFPDNDALGHALYTSTPRALWGESIPNRFEIVGIARSVKFLGPDTVDEPAFYVPSRQFPLGQMTLVARTTGDPAALIARIREDIQAVRDSNAFTFPARCLSVT